MLPLRPTPKHTIGYVLGSPAPIPTKADIPLTKMGVSVSHKEEKEEGRGGDMGRAKGWQVDGC